MLEFLGSFLGTLLGCIGAFLISALLQVSSKESRQEEENEEKREAPNNISSLKDPLSLYEKYTDDNSGLFKPIRKGTVNRIEIGRDEDIK